MGKKSNGRKRKGNRTKQTVFGDGSLGKEQSRHDSRGRKDSRDRRRKKKKGCMPQGTNVRSTGNREIPIYDEFRKGVLLGWEQVRELRHDLKIPKQLKSKIKQLFVKINLVRFKPKSQEADPWKHFDEHIRSTVVVIVFRNQVQGVSVGPIVNEAQQRKLNKITYTHAAIQHLNKETVIKEQGPLVQINSPYDERMFTLTLFQSGDGKKRHGGKKGHPVHEEQDELFVLQWLYENGMSDLCELPYLHSQGLLPLTDQQRWHAHAITNQAHMFFGRASSEFPTSKLYSERLARRIELHHADAQHETLQAYMKTFVGMEELEKNLVGNNPDQKFFYSKERNLVVAVYLMDGCKYIACWDLKKKKVEVKPLPHDHTNREMMEKYHNALHSREFTEINQGQFKALTTGIGVLT